MATDSPDVRPGAKPDAAVPEVYNHIPDWPHKIFESGISACAIVAVLLNLLFNHFSRAEDEPATDH
jgi:uric acid transporter